MAITFINSTALTIATAASTWSIPTHSSIEGGAAFVVGVGPGSSGVTVSAMTDNAGNSYALAVRRATPKPANAAGEMWYATNLSSASTRISLTLSNASSGSVAVAQFRGISTANGLLNTNSSAITANSTSHSAAEITPSESSAVVVSYIRLNASSIGTITVLGGQTTWTSTNNAVRQYGGYVIQTSASTATGSITASSQCMHAAVIAAFSDTRTIVPLSYFSGRLQLGMGM